MYTPKLPCESLILIRPLFYDIQYLANKQTKKKKKAQLSQLLVRAHAGNDSQLLSYQI